jgi:hypothetical protein
MKLLILNGPRDRRTAYNPLYRGTYRSHPTHCDEVSDDHEINRLFFWFIKEGGQLGIVRDVQKARRFAALWNARLKESERFEVVEVADAEPGQSCSGGTFLGFDLSSGYNNSLLAEGLRQSMGAQHLPEPIRELWDLTSRHYAPQLNAAGLFQTFELATLCLRSMTALQVLSPNLFEGEDLRHFRVVRLQLATQTP